MTYLLKITGVLVFSCFFANFLQAQLIDVDQVTAKAKDSLYSAHCTDVLVLKRSCSQRFCNALFTLETEAYFGIDAYIFWKSAGNSFVRRIDQLRVYDPVNFSGLLHDQLIDFYYFNQSEIDSARFLHTYEVPRDVQDFVYNSTTRLYDAKNITIYEQEYYKYNTDYKIDKIPYSDGITLEYASLTKEVRNFLYFPMSMQPADCTERIGNDRSNYYFNQELKLVQWIKMIESNLFRLEITHAWNQKKGISVQSKKKRSEKHIPPPNGWLPIKFDVEKESGEFIKMLAVSGVDTFLCLRKRTPNDSLKDYIGFAPSEEADPVYIFYVHDGIFHAKKFDRFNWYYDVIRTPFQHFQLYDFYSRNQKKLVEEKTNSENSLLPDQSSNGFPEMTSVEIVLGNLNFNGDFKLKKNGCFLDSAHGNYQLFKVSQWVHLIESELFELELNVW